MKYLFVNLFPNQYDKHSVYAVSAVLKARGDEVDYVEPRSPRDMADYSYDARLYSMYSMQVQAYVNFEENAMRGDGRPSIAGGFGVAFHNGALPFTQLCRGDCEPFFRDGLDNLCENLDELPMPDRSPVYKVNSFLSHFPTKQFITGRGCPYACAYCFNHAYKEKFKIPEYVRRKSPDLVIEEIKGIARDYPFRTAAFQDDTFILDAGWLDDFVARWNRLKPFTCNVRANLVTSEICALLKRGNCVGVNWSIESGSERIRNDLLKRRMTDVEIYRCAALLHEYGLPFRVATLIGLPTETDKDRKDSLDMARRIGAFYSFANTFVPYPGLAVTKYADAHGLCPGDGRLAKDHYRLSVLAFSLEEKESIYRLCLLWSLLAWLERGNLRLVPLWLCRLYFLFINWYSMAALYRINFFDLFSMAWYFIKTKMRQAKRGPDNFVIETNQRHAPPADRTMRSPVGEGFGWAPQTRMGTRRHAWEAGGNLQQTDDSRERPALLHKPNAPAQAGAVATSLEPVVGQEET